MTVSKANKAEDEVDLAIKKNFQDFGENNFSGTEEIETRLERV